MANNTKGEASVNTTGLANYFCKMKIGNVDIHTDSINAIIIREWIFDIVPRMELTLTDDGSLFELWPLEDTEIIVELGKTKASEHIVSTFIVDNSSVDILAGNASNIVTITAYLKYTNLFHPIHTRALKNKSSIEVLKQLASEIGWKVNSRINNSSDTMTWLQINMNNFDMIKHVLERSYIPTDLLLAYASINNKFTIKSLKDEFTDNTFKICRFDLTNAAADTFDNKQDAITLWSNGYRFHNMTGYFNKVVGGYGLTSTYYDLSKKVGLSSAIDYHPYTSLTGQHHMGEYVDSINYGTLTKNTHPNYYKGMITNRNILGSQFGNMIVAKINPIGTIKGKLNNGTDVIIDQSIELMDTINFVLPSINQKQINEIYGGFYLVCGKCWYASKGSPLQLEVSMMRNGRNKSSFNLDTTKDVVKTATNSSPVVS